jgi:hypothetical protein
LAGQLELKLLVRVAGCEPLVLNPGAEPAARTPEIARARGWLETPTTEEETSGSN